MKELGPQRTKIAIVGLVVAYAIAFAGLKLFPHYDCLVFMLVAWSLFRGLDVVVPKQRTFLLHLLTQVLVASYLVHLWTLGYEGRNAVLGGTLPLSDSYDFFEDALRLLHGHRFGEAASKRPFFGSILAVLLRFTGGSLRASLALFSIAGAFTTALATNEVWKTHGWRSAFVVWLILFFLARHWAGFVQTEHIGFPLGAVGFVMIWRANALVVNAASLDDATKKRARWLVLAGICTLMVGLMARAGAFFVVPAIALWGARHIEAPGKDRYRFLALAIGAMGVGWASHKLLLSMTGQGVTFSDYAGIFYGMMHGEDYTFLHEKHPELTKLAVGERVPAAWSIILGEAKADPSKVILGFAKSGIGIFTDVNGMFGYVWRNPDDSALEDATLMRAVMAKEGILGPLFHWQRTLGTYSLLNAGAMGALAAAFVLGTAWSTFVVLVRRRKDKALSLLRWTIAGVLVSAPFTPPWITSGQQVQTVTLAFVAALPAVVLLGRKPASADVPPKRDRIIFVPLAFIGAVVTLVGLLRLTPKAVPECQSTRVVRLLPGTLVDVKDARSFSFQDKGIDDLRYAMTFLTKHNRDARAFAPFVAPGARFVIGYDACEAKAKILVDDARRLPIEDRFVTIDAEVLDPEWVLRVTRYEPVLP